jgi:protein transport protein SEC24
MAPEVFINSREIGRSFMFLIDFSTEATSSGFTLQCLVSISAFLENADDSVRIGLMTMGNNIAVYDFNRSSQYVITDLSDAGVPGRTAAPLGDCRSQAMQVIDSLIARGYEAESNGHCLGTALFVAAQALSGYGGIIIACFSGYPTVGPEAVQSRVVETGSGEAVFLKPPDPKKDVFRSIGFRLNRAACSCHMFNLRSQIAGTSDLAQVGMAAAASGGVIRYYTTFDREKLHVDLFDSLNGEYLWDCSMRLRCSSGVKVTAVLGNCAIRDKTMFVPVMDVRNSMCFDLTIDEDITSSQVLFQCAQLWTDEAKERRIRILTVSLPVSKEVTEIRQSADELAVVMFWMKRSTTFIMNEGPIESSKVIRKYVAGASSGGFRYCSLYHMVHGLLSSPLLRPTPVDGPDGRLTALINARGFSVVTALLYLYPRLFVIDAQLGPLALDESAFGSGYCIVAHTHSRIYVWASPSTPPETMQELFGSVEMPAALPQIDTPLNQQLNKVIEECHALSGRYLDVEMIPPGSQRESVFPDILVDMSSVCGSDLKTFLTETAASFM